MQSYKVPSSEVPGYSAIYRHAEFKDGTHGGAFDNVTTLYELFQQLVDKYPKREFLGARKLRSWLKTPLFGSYEWMSVQEAATFVDEFGAGLDHVYATYASQDATDPLQQQPLGIYSANRPEWLLTELAGFRSRRFSVGICDTIGVLSAEHIINHSKTAVTVCSLDKIPRMLERMHETPGLKVIISMDKLDCSQKNSSTLAFSAGIANELKAQAETLGVKMLDIDEVRAMGRSKPTAPSLPSPSDAFSVCYTSGTTSAQKGAMLSHGAFVHATKAYTLHLKLESETYLSCLPLVHSFDRISIYTLLHKHVRVGFISGDLTNVMDDMRELKPTIICVVPRLLNRVYDRIAAATVSSKGAIGVLSRIGLKSKVKRINAGRSAKHAFWDRLIFNKIADMFGGRLKTMILGAASADAKVQTFFRTALDCNIIQAYAQTENSVACTAQVPSDITTDNVGIPLPGIDVRLRSLPSMNYYVTDAPCPRGEVMVRSKCTFTQYLGEPEKTGEIKEGEWLATGDVGQINEDGTLAIIDRIKNILKTGRGTWVALERIENIYASHPLVQSVFIHGDELQRDLVGVVVPKSESFVPWACGIVKEVKDNEKPALASLCANKEVVDALLKELKLHAVKAGLSVPEHINAIHCEAMPFENSPSRLLTSSAKLRRKVVSEHYQDEFDDLFAKLDNSTAPTVQEA